MDDRGRLAVSSIGFWLEQMARRGIAAGDVLAGTGLDAEQVRGVFRGAPEHYRTVIANMLRLTGDPRLGIALGANFGISDFGLLGYTSLSSASVRQSREVIQRYQSLDDSVLAVRSSADATHWRVELEERFALGELLPFAVEEWVSRILALGEALTGRAFPVLRMQLAYPRPARITDYRRRFACPLVFDAATTVIDFDPGRLDDPIALANEAVFTLCERHCRLAATRIASDHSLAARIRGALLAGNGEFPGLDGMAGRFGTTARTLARELMREGTSYQRLVDDARRTLACEHLQLGRLTPKQIGFLLGYRDVGNFRRAFRRWTGHTVAEFRARHAAQTP